ncbi:hypothetical protein C8D87_102679 [Lentzea atacamensis]|uniref:Uncharacterized protein n=1 Tax=Lentzea atacamensis TaxID=531938 RepID=A0ABX9EDS0_9PSEU|nr:hypothetical protein [Lentzea atacamensis]RAS68610.1 hypothetical protein C8D87_102679 [Lentzea atacamensis]
MNAVGPGVVWTGMTDVSAVLFFTADDADFVTGQVLYVSGGPHG